MSINDVLTGEGKPLDAEGSSGDIYIDLDTWDVYARTDDGWEISGNIQGARGAVGTAGEQGATGTNGINGKAGINGTNGINGKDGVSITGNTGITGKDGEDGEDGIPVELRAKGNQIQWRQVGDKDWVDLYVMPLSTGGGGGGAIKTLQAQSSVDTLTSATTLTNKHQQLLCNGTFAVTLPTSMVIGRQYGIKNIGTGTVTVVGTIDDSASVALSRHETIRIVYDGNKWWIL